MRDPAGKLDGYASLFIATFYMWEEGVPDVDHPIALGMLSLIRIQVRWLPPLQLKQGLVSYGWWDQERCAKINQDYEPRIRAWEATKRSKLRA